MTDQPTGAAIDSWARLVRVSQTLLLQIEAELKAAGFPPLVWYDALLELARARGRGLRPFELQDRMLLAQYNLSRLTDRLVKAGYVARARSTADGRGQLLTITPSGRALRKRMWVVYRRAIQMHFAAALEEDEIASLGRILEKMQR